MTILFWIFMAVEGMLVITSVASLVLAGYVMIVVSNIPY